MVTRDGTVVANPLEQLTLEQLRTRTSMKWTAHPADVLPLWVAEMDVMLAPAVADAVHRALGCLTKPNRDVVVLRYFVQLTERQTADVLGVPTGTVKSRLSRSLALLAANDHILDLSGGASR